MFSLLIVKKPIDFEIFLFLKKFCDETISVEIVHGRRFISILNNSELYGSRSFG